VLPPRKAAETAFQWLVGSLRAGILAGGPRARGPPPAARRLARQDGPAPGTGGAAVEQLPPAGHRPRAVRPRPLLARVSSDDLMLTPLPRGAQHARAANTAPRRLSAHARRARLFPGYRLRKARAFHPNLPALDLFPTTLWAQVTARRLRKATTRLLLGSDPL